MNYIRRLYCLIYGHETYTVAVPQPDGNRQEVLDYCMRCEHTRQLTHVITD